MIPTIRFVAAIVLGVLLIGFSDWSESLALAGTAVISLVIVLLLADWLRLTRGARLEVTRDCENKLSLGAENAVRIRVRNNSYIGLSAIVRDEYPEGMTADGNTFAVNLSPRSETDRLYHVTPLNRGDYEFGDTYVRLKGPLGLAIRQMRFPARKAVKVYPNLLDMRRYDIGLKRRVALQPGQRATRVYGRGAEFESLRDYVPDDEFRSVDWKATARRGKLVARQYQQERSQNVVILLDCGRTMGPVIAGLTKLDHAINAGMMLAHVAAVKGDKVGLMAFREDIAGFVPPRAGRSQVLSLLSMAYNLTDAEGESNYSRASSYFARRWTRRSLVVIFTDLVDSESSKPLIAQIAGLSRRHLCMCVVMTDPALVEAARSEPATAEDAFRSAAARQALKARSIAAAELARFGAVVVDVPPHEFTPGVVQAYLDVKARGRL